MSSEDLRTSSSEASSAVQKPLPKGYVWRLCVVLALLLGGVVFLIFFSTIIGSLISLAALAFGKMSGLNDMLTADRENAAS